MRKSGEGPVSEYQYYEFIAVDRPLTDKELDAVRATSTRARVTRTSFVNEYHFGNFKGSPDRLVEKYFDAHLYTSNFRSQRFMFRVPVAVLEPSAIEAYGGAGVLEIRRAGDIVVLDFNCNLDEIGEEGTQDAEGLMSSLIPVRDEVLSGDFRALYLGWLSGVHHGLVVDEDPEPLVPPGLGTLTASQSALAEFLCLDQDLLEEAARSSVETHAEAVDAGALRRWLADLSAHEKDQLLLGHVTGAEPHLRVKLLARFKAARGRAQVARPATTRTVGDLLSAGEARREERQLQARKKAEVERKRQAEQEARRRASSLETLSARVPQTWAKVEELIATRSPQGYGDAVKLIADLRDLARAKGTLGDYSRRVESIVTRHEKKVNLVKKVRSSGLLNE